MHFQINLQKRHRESLRPLIPNQLPPYLSLTAVHFFYHLQPLRWPQSDWKIQCTEVQESARLTAEQFFFQSKTTVNSKRHQIVQIDVWHEGELTEQYRKEFTDVKRNLQPAYYRYAVYFHGGFNPFKNISKEKNTDWQILLRLKTCCSSSFIFRPGNLFPVTDPTGQN